MALTRVKSNVLDVGTSSGQIPVLGVGGSLPVSTIPQETSTQVYSVADLPARDALIGVAEGDIAIVDDAGSGIPNTYIYNVTTWKEIKKHVPPVLSVNNQTGSVTITNISGNAGTATALQTTRSIVIGGDATGSSNFNGTANAQIDIALTDTGVSAGQHTKVTVDAKGRVSAGTTLASGDIPNLSWNKITSDKPTSLTGYGITDAMPKAGGTFTNFVTLHADPTSAMHAATKQYVDGVATGLAIHEPVRLATTTVLAATYDNGILGVGATLTMNASAAFVLDNISGVLYDRILVKDQNVADAEQNGIYELTTVGDVNTKAVLTRASDFDNSPTNEIHDGDFFFVQEGDSNQHKGFVQTAVGPITIGTNDIIFSQFSGADALGAGPGLVIDSNEYKIGTASTSRIVVNSDNIDLATTGVSPNTYNNVTVDAYGRVTNGSNVSYLTGNQTITFTSDVTGSGTTNIAMTLANTTVNPGSYGSASAIPVITVDSKGRLTSVSTAAVNAVQYWELDGNGDLMPSI